MQLEIALIEPFFSGSHAAWAQSLKKFSKHKIHLITMPGRYWKWRMHGGAITTARNYLAGLAPVDPGAPVAGSSSPGPCADFTGFRPRLILATDMLDLTSFLALTRRATAGIPVAIYFHESQFSYPAGPEGPTRRQNDAHYPFINYVSALAADRIYFNSAFHRDDFLRLSREYPRQFPDYREESAAAGLAHKSRVLALGLELSGIATEGKTDAEAGADACAALRAGPPVILWNHRWEHDKNPEDFFGTLFALKRRGCKFRLVVLGQRFRKAPAIFARAREQLREEIVRFEAAGSRAEYLRWLPACDICPVTSRHDFFGAAVVEAMAAGCYPLLPRRLAYPEHVDDEPLYLYDTNRDLLERLEAMLRQPGAWRTAETRAALKRKAERYDWAAIIDDYDREFADLVESFHGAGGESTVTDRS
jgi:glycosyltransferase involved in cell wall biosynthesis